MLPAGYLKSFEVARRQNINQLYAIPVTGFSSERIGEIPQLKLDHLKRMTDGTGMLQHSVYSVPNYNEGYTTDDNPRALIVTVQLERIPTLSNSGTDEQLLATGQELSRRYLAFLWHAFNPERKQFRNFMAYNRTWLEEIGSEDSHGRTLWALGTVLNQSTDEGLRGMAGRLFDSAISSALTFNSPRAWAFTILGTEVSQEISGRPGRSRCAGYAGKTTHGAVS